MPQPADVTALSDALTALYQRAWEHITAQEEALLNDWPLLRGHERMARLRELRAVVETLMDQADAEALRYTQQQLPLAYATGAAAAAVPVSYTLVDTDAVAALAQTAYTDLLDATAFVRQSAKDLIRTLAREHVADKLLTGQTAEQAGQLLAQDLEGRGITAVVYRNGARHGLADYAEMLTRTKTAEAYTTATLNQLKQAGIEWVEVFDSRDCGLTSHDDPDKPGGTVRRLTEMERYPISHPRCVRAVGGRADITSAADAKTASPSTTPQQQADQLAVEQQRRQAVADRAAVKRFEAMVSRRADGLLTDAGNRVRSPAYARALARRQLRAQRVARRAGQTTGA